MWDTKVNVMIVTKTWDYSFHKHVQQFMHIKLHFEQPSTTSAILFAKCALTGVIQIRSPDVILLKMLLYIYLVENNKNVPPSKCYWNDNIPIVISKSTQAEQWLISRVVPFVKVVKYDEMFGQLRLSPLAFWHGWPRGPQQRCRRLWYPILVNSRVKANESVRNGSPKRGFGVERTSVHRKNQSITKPRIADWKHGRWPSKRNKDIIIGTRNTRH